MDRAVARWQIYLWPCAIYDKIFLFERYYKKDIVGTPGGVLLEQIKATYDVACKTLNTEGFGPATGLALRATVF